jgi:hypothetical protein
MASYSMTAPISYPSATGWPRRHCRLCGIENHELARKNTPQELVGNRTLFRMALSLGRSLRAFEDTDGKSQPSELL